MVDTSTELSRNQVGIIKELILEAARIHEGSWNADAKEYKISLEQACELVSFHSNVGELTKPIYLLLKLAWNDIIAWAEAYPKPEGENAPS